MVLQMHVRNQEGEGRMGSTRDLHFHQALQEQTRLHSGICQPSYIKGHFYPVYWLPVSFHLCPPLNPLRFCFYLLV